MITASRRLGRELALGCALVAISLTAIPARAADFPVGADDKAVGSIQEYVVHQGDLLADIARKYDIGYTEMLAANPGVDPWSPRPGTRLRIPSLYILPNTPHQGIVLNLAERRLYYYPPRGGAMQTYPIGIGAVGFDTPHSVTRVVAKVPEPTWYPTASSRDEQPDIPAAIPPGPDNPLGAYELRLGWNNYLIHGTNKPDGVGRNVSHGCIHLYPEDIAKLYDSVAIGTQVRVIEQPAGITWLGDGLYVEAHPSKDQADAIDTEQPMTPEPLAGLRDQVAAAAGDSANGINWSAVDQAAARRSGLPINVATRGASAPIANGAPAGPAGAAPLAEIAQAPAAPPPRIAPASPAETLGPPISLVPLPDTAPPLPAAATAPYPAPAAAPQTLTPIFHTLQPPPGMVPTPRDAVGPIQPWPYDARAVAPPDPDEAYNPAQGANGPTWDRGWR